MAVRFFSTSSIAKGDLPSPVIVYSTSGSSDNVMAVTATAFSAVSVTAIGTIEAAITLPYACNVIITYSAWLTAGPNTEANSIRVGTAASGANTWTAGGATSYAIALAAGTTTIQMQAYRTSTALTTANVNFPFLSVTPVSWA